MIFIIFLYSIYDVVENFNCKSDWEKCSEFYIDEIVINYYIYNYRSRFL